MLTSQLISHIIETKYYPLLFIFCLQEWLAVLSDDDELDDDDDEALEDWAKLETMRFSHPMDFAKKLTEVDVNVT